MRSPFQDFKDMSMKDSVILQKKNGTVFTDINASVQDGSIHTFATQIPFEDGDTIVRSLHNGVDERYIILEADFLNNPYAPEMSLYQIKVRRETSLERSMVNNTYNLSGPNSRVNVGSTDNSVNPTINQTVAHQLNLETLTVELAKLRSIVRQEATEAEHDGALGAIASAETAAKKGDEQGVLQHLAKAGQWVLDVATKVGISVVAEAIKKAMFRSC